MEPNYDVIVIGAGPGGSSAAHYLAKAGLKVLLLDKADFPREKTCGDGLTPHALSVLDDMGILPEVQQVGHRVNGILLQSPRGETVSAPIPKRDGKPDYLLVVPRLKLDEIIRQRALASGADFQSPLRVVDVWPDERGVTVLGERANHLVKFRGRMSVVATGVNTRLLQTIGLIKRLPQMVVAARAYYENVLGLDDTVQARAKDVPMPGYGWIFPTSETAANVGIGIWPSFLARNRPKSARAAFGDFVNSLSIQPILATARQIGPLKGYPIRTDFHTSPTFRDRILLVGESAGLVNPLTGEGIDLALESGKLAARQMIQMFHSGDFSLKATATYDRVLRWRYQQLFVLLTRLRTLYVNPYLGNRIVRVTKHVDELRALMVDIFLGFQDAAKALTPEIIWRVIRGK